jgi:hypothetical protein
MKLIIFIACFSEACPACAKWMTEEYRRKDLQFCNFTRLSHTSDLARMS